MASDCSSLLSAVCEVLPNPKLLLPDDTSLEKLLDWFKDLISHSNGQDITLYQPCLLEFLHTMTKSEAVDSTVFSFSLKLTGLLASKVDSFSLLQERGVLLYMFDPDSWHEIDHWKNASVRGGWLQGLCNMLQHQQAVAFFCRRGLIKLLLTLQNDESLFLASLTNQILVKLLNSVTLPVMSNNIENIVQTLSPVSTDLGSVTTEVISHVIKSLASEEQAVIISGLRLLAVTIAQCSDPVKRMLWKHALEPFEVLANLHDDSLNVSVVAVLQAAAKSPLLIEPECRVEPLVETLLYSRNINESVQCAGLILQVDSCPDDLKKKATDVILSPLLCVTAATLQPQLQDSCDSLLADRLSQKTSCVPLLTQSLSNIADLVCKNSLDDVSVRSTTSSVIRLLNICIGHQPSTSLEPLTTFHLIGCSKIQKYSLDVLQSLTASKESMDFLQDALAVLLLYLQGPDVHATIFPPSAVLSCSCKDFGTVFALVGTERILEMLLEMRKHTVFKKSFQATLKWLGVASDSPTVLETISHDIFPLLKKLVCDGRWEVRDSTLEFIMQLTATFKGNPEYNEAFQNSGMISAVLSSLSDGDSYVQASAVSALGKVLTDIPLCGTIQEEAIRHLLSILSKDAESFPRRAAMKVFTSWLKSPLPFADLDNHLSSVLLLGSSDFDWEVKVQTLEIAAMLMDNPLSCSRSSPEIDSMKQPLHRLMDAGVFDLLLKCLFDCDRPVSHKACTLLLKLRTVLRETDCAAHSDLTLEISRYSWGEEVLQRFHKNQQPKESSSEKNQDPASPKKISLCEILELLELEEMQYILSLSSDHVINSPRSLMEDILFVAQQSEINVVDCY